MINSFYFNFSKTTDIHSLHQKKNIARLYYKKNSFFLIDADVNAFALEKRLRHYQKKFFLASNNDMRTPFSTIKLEFPI
jgi:hypothetical protein